MAQRRKECRQSQAEGKNSRVTCNLVMLRYVECCQDPNACGPLESLPAKVFGKRAAAATETPLTEP